MRYKIAEKDDGKSVKTVIGEWIHPSSKMLKSLKYRPNGIMLNGRQVTVRATVRTGDCLELLTEDTDSGNLPEPVDLPIEILYEDGDIVVPSKLGNMPTHPSHDHRTDTVANALAYRYKGENSPFVFRPINRLDRETSGLLLVARSKLSAGRLTVSMQSGQIHKTYLAVLYGSLPTAEGEIDLPLHRSAKSIIVREICSPDTPDAEPSLTKFRVLEERNGYSLVEAKPMTGRTHQLRVHFASQGCPILGDSLYGTADNRIGRQALHARSLTFPHPTTNEILTFTAPLPKDFSDLVCNLFPDWKEDFL